MMMYLAVLRQYQYVTDGRTDILRQHSPVHAINMHYAEAVTKIASISIRTSPDPLLAETRLRFGPTILDIGVGPSERNLFSIVECFRSDGSMSEWRLSVTGLRSLEPV